MLFLMLDVNVTRYDNAKDVVLVKYLSTVRVVHQEKLATRMPELNAALW
jgi:hypothetical protein